MIHKLWVNLDRLLGCYFNSQIHLSDWIICEIMHPWIIGWFGQILGLLVQLTNSLVRLDNIWVSDNASMNYGFVWPDFWVVASTNNFSSQIGQYNFLLVSYYFIPELWVDSVRLLGCSINPQNHWSDCAIWFSDNFICRPWIMGWFDQTLGLLLQLAKSLVILGNKIF